MRVLQKHIQVISLAVIFSIALTLPMEIKYGNIAIIAGFIISLFYLKKRDFTFFKFYVFSYPFIFFTIALISGLFSKDIISGLSRLDRHLIPLLLTIVFIVCNKAPINKTLSFYSFVITGTTLVLSSVVIFHFYQGVDLNQLVFHNYTALYDQHPVYYALMILVALLFLLVKIKDVVSWQELGWQWYLQINILGSGLVLCASKAVIVVFIILLLIGSIVYLRGRKRTLIILLSLTFFFLLVYKVEYINKRFFEGISLEQNIMAFRPTNDFTLKKRFDYDEKLNISDFELRILLSKISMYHMLQDRVFLFGYGSGDAQDYLDYYLYSYNLGPNWYQGFNVHNQYLHIVLNYGIFVLCLFLYYLGAMFRYAIRKKDFLHIAVLMAFSFVFLFEVSLIRNKGIVLFYFFNLLFLTNHSNFENCNIRNTRDTQ